MSQTDPLDIVGQIVADKYRIDRMVGEGGFAVVYLAEHTIWKKPVAIKFFNGLSNAPLDQRENLHKAFINEGALLTELSSHTANIVQARDVGTYTTPQGQWMPYMVLEWLEGMALDELLERERLAGTAPWTLTQVVRLLAPIARALELAHQRGVAHRDIKPGNIFVIGEGARSATVTVKLLDFGVAKMMTENTQMKAALAKTGHSITSFTPLYGTPEQFSRSYGATGPWTDVFALALVAVEMMIGRPALDGEDTIQLAFAASDPTRRPTPRRLGVLVPDAVEAVFQKALAISPVDRYESAGEFWSALEAATTSQALEDTLYQPDIAVAPPSLDVRGPRATAQPTTGGASVLSTASYGKSGNKGILLLFGGLAGLGVVAGVVLAAREQGGTPAAAAQSEPSPAVGSARAAPSAAPAAVPAPSCPPDMVEIPAGQYFMGSDGKDAMDNEKPVHHVRLSAFCMDLTEVTAGKYKACSDQGSCRRAATEVEWPGISAKEKQIYSPLCTVDDEDKADHPINCVTWHMATIYCKAQGKRLPTEAEWEYATRGPDGRVYPWGDEAPTAKHLNACGSECVAWGKQRGLTLEPLFDADDGYPTTAPVGSFPAGSSRFGPQDVAGNVWEWVQDWYGEYAAPGAAGADRARAGTETVVNPAGPESGQKRVTRGGAWNGSYASWLRPSFRYGMDPAAMSHGIGFRCAKSVPTVE